MAPSVKNGPPEFPPLLGTLPLDVDGMWARVTREYGRAANAQRSAAVEAFGARVTAGWRAYPEAQEVLDAFGRRGYRMGMISDVASPSHHWRALVHDLGIAGCFSVMVFSSDVGRTKPAREPFLEALDALGARPEETAYVGDTPQKDIDGAAAVGITPVHIRRRPEAPKGSHRPALTVSTLVELLGHLPGRPQR